LSDRYTEFVGTREVDARLRLDPGALEGWMRAHVEGFAGKLAISQFKGGQSNLAYLLSARVSAAGSCGASRRASSWLRPTPSSAKIG